MQHKNLKLCLALVLASGVMSAKATTMEQLDTENLTRKSNGIHVGEVIDRHSEKDAATGMIYTNVTMKVDQTIKGSPANTVTLRIPGGQFGEYGMVVHGMANFRTGERALVFVREEQNGTRSIVGMSQGKFKIVKSLLSGEEQALSEAPKNVEFFSKSPNGQIRHVVSTQVDRKIPLSTLLSDIKAAVAREGMVSH